MKIRTCASITLVIMVLALLSLVGCGGRQAMSSPNTYGSQAEKDDAEKKSPDLTPPRDEKNGPMSYRYGNKDEDTATSDDSATAKSTPEVIPSHKSLASDPAKKEITLAEELHRQSLYELEAYNEDSASAVDDDIWRLFDLASEYHQMGVVANREASWEEAQYYFERSLKILANLDVESDSVLTPEATRYNTILDNVVSDYRITMRSLGHLEQDAPPSVLIERFGDMETRLAQDSIRVYKDERAPVTYDLPVVMNDRVKKSIVYFQTVADNAFRKYMSRSKRYRWLYDDVLAEHGLPNDLVYLSLVESGFNPHAYSWARAMGLWQFIASTGRMYGLKRDWWVDERKDPVKATHAAARFLKDLYDQFGHWELAMAAYNGGPGRVSRTIKKQKTIDFWKLKLKRQTMDYVPLIYAAAIISKNPEKYGFTGISFEDEIRWDEVTIDRCLDLKVVAKELNCSYKTLKELNPELLRQYTPPNRKKYVLKVPVGSTQKFFAAYDNMPSPKETSWVKHQIRRGETVSTIASRYGVSQYAIFAANNLSRKSRIYAGKSLIVPVPLDRDYSAPAKNKSYESDGNQYTVRSGDTMWDIARAFGTTVDALRRINYIERGSRIYVGQRLKLPSNAVARKNSSSKSRQHATISAAPDNSGGSSGSKTYRVRKGDTLWDIARAHNTTTGKIRSLNGLGRSSRIYPGQVLQMAGSSAEYVVYKVRRGDTLDRIARQYRTTIARIAAANGMTDPDNLRVGATLKIYTR